MADEFSQATLKMVVGQICQTIGWHSINVTPLNILVDILGQYMTEFGKLIHAYSEHGNRTMVMLPDIAKALDTMGVSLSDLEDYVNNVESTSLPPKIPKYPASKESNLNFLKPGSREVVLRPIYIHDHLPPMYPEAHEDTSSLCQSQTQIDTVDSSTYALGDLQPECTAMVNGISKIENTLSMEAAATIARRMRFEEQLVRQMREISSVMMTTGGFISPAREGKHPESRMAFWLDKGPFLEEVSDEEIRDTKAGILPENRENVKPRPAPMKDFSRGESKAGRRPFDFDDDAQVRPPPTPAALREQKSFQGRPGRIPSRRNVRGGRSLIRAMPASNNLIRTPPTVALMSKRTKSPKMPMLVPKNSPGDSVPKNVIKRQAGRPPKTKSLANGRGSSPQMPPLIPKAALRVDAELSGREIGITVKQEANVDRPLPTNNALPAVIKESVVKEVPALPSVVPVKIEEPVKRRRPSSDESSLDSEAPSKKRKVIPKSRIPSGEPVIEQGLGLKKRKKMRPSVATKSKTPAMVASSPSSSEAEEKQQQAPPPQELPRPKSPPPPPPVATKPLRRSPTPPPLPPPAPQVDEKPVASPPLLETGPNLYSSVFSSLPAHPSFIPNFLPKAAGPPPFGGPPTFVAHPSLMPFKPTLLPGLNNSVPRIVPSAGSPPGDVDGRDSPIPRPASSGSHSSLSRPETPASAPQVSVSKSQEAKAEEQKEKRLRKEKKKEKKEEKKRRKEEENRKKKDKKKTKLEMDSVRSFAESVEAARSVPKLTLKISGGKDLSPSRSPSPFQSSPPVPPAAATTNVTAATPVVSPPAPLSKASSEVKPKITIKPIKKPDLASKSTADQPTPKDAPITATPDPESKKSKNKLIEKKPKLKKAKLNPSSGSVASVPVVEAPSEPPAVTAATVDSAASSAAPGKPRGRGRPSKLSMQMMASSSASSSAAAAAVVPVPAVAAAPAPPAASAAQPLKKLDKGLKKKEDAGLITETVGSYVVSTDAEGNKIWICPFCGRVDDGTPMIGCDSCDDWYHWVCVGIVEEPVDEKWFCPRCLAKDKGKPGKLKGRKKTA
ncbi:unnamed protein product [Notodromas monacha]|uniref:PHD-type domain-containing protein n=1 Tax=Notodromas monacha TaxID=399045 RepID=A0A7R9BG00_9CRUS|nr:unnamed protein product [Notodromas monacha]CAG0913928.1 unnamed protein product [Notodromas monacha]